MLEESGFLTYKNSHGLEAWLPSFYKGIMLTFAMSEPIKMMKYEKTTLRIKHLERWKFLWKMNDVGITIVFKMVQTSFKHCVMLVWNSLRKHERQIMNDHENKWLIHIGTTLRIPSKLLHNIHAYSVVCNSVFGRGDVVSFSRISRLPIKSC